MLSNRRYRESWEAKKRSYHENGIMPWDRASNGEGQLIITRDGDNGGDRRYQGCRNCRCHLGVGTNPAVIPIN